MTEKHDGDQIEVRDAPEASRYEAWVDGRLAGFVLYRIEPNRIELVHTEVDDAFEGRGIGSRLAVAALDDARARGLAVTPTCPFIAGYIRRHPDYGDLVGDGS